MKFLASVVDSMPAQNLKTFGTLCRAHQRAMGKADEGLKASGKGKDKVYEFTAEGVVKMRRHQNIAKGLTIFRKSYAAHQTRTSKDSSKKDRPSSTSTGAVSSR